MLIVENLKRYYGKDNVIVKALDGVSFSVEKGEFVAVVGSSGSGKSTLLHLLGGLDMPTEGKVFIDKINLYEMKEDERTIFRRRKIGFVFQNYNLLPMLNVFENIMLPLGLDGQKGGKDFVEEILSILHIEDQKHKMPHELSGGQQQRVAIARSLVTKPSLILADEPTGNLDSTTSSHVIRHFKNINQKMGNTIVLITHDNTIAQMADRILRIEDGKLVSR